MSAQNTHNRLKRKFWLYLCGLLLLTHTFTPSIAVASHNGQQDTLIAAFPENFPPVYMVTENRLPTGFGVEFMELIATRMKVHVEYRAMSDWEAVQNALRRGEVDLIPDLGIIDTRDFAFTRPVVNFSLKIFVRREENSINRIDDIRSQDRTIAVVHSNAGKLFAQRQGNLTTREYNSLADALIALRTGKVDALLYPAEVVNYLAKRLGIDDHIKSVGDTLLSIPRGIAVQKERKDLQEKLDAAVVDVMQTPEFRLAYERWFPREHELWSLEHLAILLAALLTTAILVAIIMHYFDLRRSNSNLRHLIVLNQAILDTSWEAILTLDTNWKVHSANPAASRIFKLTQDQLTGTSINSLLKTDDNQPPNEILKHYIHTARSGSDRDRKYEMLAVRESEFFPVSLSIAQLEEPSESLLILSIHDLTKQRRAEKHARFLIDHDPLTGLLNQHGAQLILQNMINRSRRNNKHLCCIVIGLDRFPHINDVHGRLAGDRLLTAVGAYLESTLRSSDIVAHPENTLVARGGGDRFLLVLDESNLESGSLVSERLLEGIHSISVDGKSAPLRTDARAGMACFPQHGNTASELVSHAEVALGTARENPVQRIQEFSSSLHSQRHEEDRNLQLIFDALDRDHLILHFQPVMHINQKSIRHYEVLVRIDSPDAGLVMPGIFIPIAEHHGLISRIDYAVLRMAFSHLAGASPDDNFRLAVNISAAHFGDKALLNWLQRNFDEGVVKPNQFIFEVTETAALRNIAQAQEFMEPLRALGCRFALDDFGVGFSSFEYLRMLPVDYVKIDGSFIRNMPENTEDQAIARAITEVAHATGREVIAEFVEGPEHLRWASKFGIDYAQGYYIGRPGPAPPHVIERTPWL